MKKQNKPREYITTYQLKLPVDFEKIIEISDPVYTFCEVMDHIDLSEYLVFEENETGRPRYDAYTLLKVILFAFMEYGYASTRFIEKLCKTDIRFMWLLEDRPAPSHMTIDNVMKHRLVGSIEGIFIKINEYIFEKQDVDLNHVYIDGTKLRANANMYSWVWKKSCVTSRNKVFEKVTKLLCLMNETVQYHGVKFGTRDEYAIEYLEELQSRYARLTMLELDKPTGRGHRKSVAR
ncbi:MAG: transposase, partial [Clostridia bacterium]|nr:transposase [Clostridia bacterium]